MRALEFIKENWGPEQYPGVLPVGDYLSPDSEFVDPTGKKDPLYLHQEVDELINAGVRPRLRIIKPSQLVATQDWLSNDPGDGPLYPEYAKLPVIYQKNGNNYILDGHHRVTAALKSNRAIECYLFTDTQYNKLKQGMAEARKANTKAARAEFGKRQSSKPKLSDKEQQQKQASSDEAWARLMAYIEAEKKKQSGVAEADDPKFVGFMNKAMANKVDAPKADPLAKAPDWYKNAPVMNFDSMPGHKKALQFGLRVLSKLDPETKKQLAAGGEQAIVDYLVDVSERTLGPRGTIDFVEEDIWECQDYLSNVFHDPNITSWVDVLKTSVKEAKQKAVPSSQRDSGALATRSHIASQQKRHADWEAKQRELEDEFYRNHPELDDRPNKNQGKTK